MPSPRRVATLKVEYSTRLHPLPALQFLFAKVCSKLFNFARFSPRSQSWPPKSPPSPSPSGSSGDKARHTAATYCDIEKGGKQKALSLPGSVARTLSENCIRSLTGLRARDGIAPRVSNNLIATVEHPLRGTPRQVSAEIYYGIVVSFRVDPPPRSVVLL